MRTLIVSDLHFGQPGRIENADRVLFDVLMSDVWDRVIFLGDMFDLWHFEYSEIVVKHKGILAAIDDLACDVIYIPGNHDDAFRGMKRLNNMRVAWPPFEFEDSNKRISVSHGDEFDTIPEPFSKISSWIVTTADKIACWLLGQGSSIQRNIRKSFASMGDMREQYTKPFAEKAVAEMGADIVILGHTHMPEVREFDTQTYINCGDFGPEHMTYVIVDNGVADLRWIDK